jgi:hypothetical protein
MDSFTIAIVAGIVVVLGIFVILVFVDKGSPTEDKSETGK